MPERIETERLVLRRWTDADREPFAAMNADPEVMRFFVEPLTRQQSDALMDRCDGIFAEHGFGMWALERRDGGGFVGVTGLAPVRWAGPLQGRIEVGWRLARPAWGHGFASEAARAAVADGFGKGLDAILAMTAEINARSRAVMDRIGMRYDPSADFQHPNVPEGHRLRPHVVYRLTPG